MPRRQRPSSRKLGIVPTQNASNRTVMVSTTVFVGALLLVVIAMYMIFGARRTSGGPRSSVAAYSMKPIDGIPCNANEFGDYHIHSHLTILDRGRTLTVPAYVGIPSDSCLYWLHTHDDSGIIHVEAPKTFKAYLGQFFDIWGAPLSRSRVASAHAPAPYSLRVWVNGLSFRGDPRRIQLRDHENISLEIGPPFPKPRSYDFSGY